MASESEIQEDLGVGLDLALTDGRQVPAHGRGFLDNVQLLVGLAGSARAAARQLGVAESTFRAWRHGAMPRHNRTRDLVAAGRELARGNTFTQAWNGQADLAVRATVKHSEDKRKRTIHPGRNIPRFAMQGLLKAWLNGADHRQLGQAMIRLIDTYYQPFRFYEVNRVWFE